MRYVAIALVAALGAACGTDDPIGDGDGDGSGSGSGSGSGGGELMPPARGFQLVSPEITIQPGEEITYCYYFKTPNTETLSIKRWQSVMTPGSHHLIMYFTPQLAQPEGTVSSSNCGAFSGGGGSSNIPSWVYSAQNEAQDLTLPADDGNGQPVGMDIPAGQAGYIELHYNNKGDDPLVVHAKVNAEAYDAGVVTTKTYAYVTYDGSISIPGGAGTTMPAHKETLNCNIPATSKVWMMSTHTHQLSVKTEVRNGTEVVFTGTDWAHPGARMWMDAPFYQFSSGRLTIECTYHNPGTTTVVEGESARTNEMCMASGYVFPATKSSICYNGFVL